MTVYVDEIRDWTLIARARGLRHTHWCHLTADTESELHAFAARLGLRRSWYQRKGPTDYRWHYDVTPNKRAHAVRLGAVEIDQRGLAAIMSRRREEARSTVGPHCGNNPHAQLTDGDRQALADFGAYLAQRKTEAR